MGGSPTTNYWDDDGKITLNPPARLLDQSGQWIPSTMGPVANTLAFLRAACEADGEVATIPLQIVTHGRPRQHLASAPESENRRQRGMTQQRELHTLSPRPRRVADAGKLTATTHDVVTSSRPHQPPLSLPFPSPVNISTQRRNNVGKSSSFVSGRTTSTTVHNMTTGLQHPLPFAPIAGTGHRPSPQIRHLATVPRALSVRRAGPTFGSSTAARQPTPKLDPPAISDRVTHAQVDNTTRRSEYPSPPHQTSYYTAGIEPIYHPNGQVRTFSGPYFLSREQAYNVGRWQQYPDLTSSPPTAATDRSQEDYSFQYIDPATSSAELLARPFHHDDEELVLSGELNHSHASFHLSCNYCSQDHLTSQCPYMPEPH